MRLDAANLGGFLWARAALGLASAVGAGFAFGRGWPLLGLLATAVAAALLWRAIRRERRRARWSARLATHPAGEGGAHPQPAPGRDPGEAFAAATRLIDEAPRAMLLIDSEGGVAFANHSARVLLERDPAGRPLTASLRDPALVEALAAASPRAEIDIARHGPAARLIQAWVRPIPPGAVSPPAPAPKLKALVVMEDVTAARREAEIRTEFVANVSHELKTPLAAIQGLAETLQGSAREDPEAQARFLRLIAAQTGRMTRLVEDLLSLRRIETDEHVPPRRIEDLGAILDEALSVVRPLAEERGIRVEADDFSACPPIYGDRDQLAQLFVNLLDNAVKYGGKPGGPPVRLKALGLREGNPRLVGAAVQDRGPGFEDHERARLTERFYRVSAASSKAKGGTGLGLAIVKHIVNRHRGVLEIDGAPGKGARFAVWLPTAPATPQPPAKPAAQLVGGAAKAGAGARAGA
ncbi:sensor histidine kinase [Neomegalonema perideroedes]|uniref:sensor histidine kinase n=1 Tax=Neomegalonema perideroedes TaxID=217219 RepID=UPI001F0B0217|nr:ATP-binding protein [Neomegalonema perideroedes]